MRNYHGISTCCYLGESYIVIPSQRPFSHLKRPENLTHVDYECPANLLVDVNATVASIISLIESYIALTVRVPPLLIARLFRGGKTTVLKLVFEHLRLQQDILPIIISLNDGFILRTGESLQQAILNAIAFQFIEVDPTESPIQFQCDNKTALFAHIASLPYTKVVLLIDELNRFGLPVDQSVATFLKTHFLDKFNFYLVFTSHQPIDIEAETVSVDAYVHGGSGRTVVLPDHLPQTNNLNQLQGMPGCGAITRCELSLYGGIPSLLYTSKNLLASEMPRNRFNRYWAKARCLLTEDNRTVLLRSYLRELRTGESAIAPPSVPKLFDSFASHYKTVDEKWFKSWPLCYIECILYEFGFTSMREITDALIVFAAQTESGKDWECMLIAGIYIWCLDTMMNPVLRGADGRKFRQHGPFDIAGSKGIAGVSLKNLPAQGESAITTIDEALTFFRSMKLQDSHVVIAIPTYAKFPDYDGFLCYNRAKGSAPTIIGFQCKKDRAYPKHEVPKGISKAVLLRGNEPSATFAKKKWAYYNEEQVRTVLGWSLRHLFAADWGEVPLDDAFD